MSTIHGERTMFVGEKDYVGFSFQGGDLPTGVTVTSGTVAVTPSPGLTLGSGTALITGDNDGAWAWLTAVTAGVYDVKFTISFSDTKTLVRIYRVRVE